MTEKYARVWSGTEWVNVSSPIASPNSVAVYQSTAPTSPVTGQVWVNSSNSQFFIWNGSSWIQVSIDLSSKANISSPTFTGVPAAPTAGAGTNTTQIATTAFVTALVPSQTGNSGKYLTTNGTSTSWGVVDLSSKANIASPTFTGTVSAGNINPSSTNSFDLGTTLLRWRNIYTQDLHLSNGIGDYTIVEGEEDLFIVNNKNKKSYKFMLTEVNPSEIPPKSES